MCNKRTYYHTCEYCGANLDPGEICDCIKKENSYKNKTIKIISTGYNKNNIKKLAEKL